ncbi:phospho-N-acetylmuramoyl-pentapeptide-transferase [Myxococcota bacterium]|nr:phospho-N-acetylmuramoyl-pentapeptide-transferase [Myxococcota bacterium]MBU1383072.1 phospho-N-acetylmuramoyl-pentapeptide-transferase [Myxococcota bacterium]MBU1498245.1 phospho-N-acetylmuramoyl-pentapeptide-transferase [Myxococcota bacterium]
MFFHLSIWLREITDSFTWLNVFRYTSTRVVLATLSALIISFLLSPWFIKRLQSQQLAQPIRDDGPETHLKKQGTPTMGGTLILFSLVLPTILWADLSNMYIWVVLTVTTLYGVLGFLDDYLKISRKNTAGLHGRFKLIFQIIVATGVFFYLYKTNATGMADATKFKVALPFISTDSYPVLPFFLFLFFAVFVVVGTSNAVNLTDGLDGLAIGPVILNAFVFMIIAYAHGAVFYGKPVAEYLKIMHVPGVEELIIFCGAVIGAGVGFLWYNTYPAQVFMGDVGSLALGGGIGTLAVLTKSEYVLLLSGGIFVMEALSVIIQVGYFKISGGKRIFLMAPIHHHFEKKGWAEPKVIVRFWVISFILSLLAIVTLKLH